MRTSLLALTAALALSAVSASALTIGHDVIDREFTDNFDDFNLAFTDLVLVEGTLNSWSYFAKKTGDISLLVLEATADSSIFTVQHSFSTTVSTTGLEQTVSITGGAAVEDGWILGLYQSDGQIVYDNGGGTIQFATNGSGAVGVGNDATIGGGPLSRSYSISVDMTPVPLPAALPLMVAAFGGLGLMARRKKRAA